MQRWHLTVGLGGLVLAAAFLAPRLQALGLQLPSVPPVPPVAPMVRPPDLPPVPPVPPPTDALSGHIVVEAGLDRTAVLEGVDNDRFLTVSLRAPADIGRAFRRPVSLGVVMDVSGSMVAQRKIDQARQSARYLATHLGPDDRFALVTFSDEARTVLPSMAAGDMSAALDTIDRVQAYGATNIYAGLQEGRGQIAGTLDGESIGRVILLSDGQVKGGVSDPAAFARLASEMASQGITVSTVGLGLDYNEDLMQKIADLGGGSHHFVDDPSDLEAAFRDELERSAATVARATRVHIELPPGVEPVELIGWTARRVGNGWDVEVGDLYAGDTRKVVARVRVRGSEAGAAMPVAEVTTTYTDLIDDAPGRDRDAVTAEVTRQEARVRASVDRDRAIEAARAYGNSFLERSTRAYETGNIAEADDLARQGAEVLQQNAMDLSAPALIPEAENLVQQRTVFQAAPPTSEAGRRAIKTNKDFAIDAAR